MKKTIYTIGHSDLTTETLIKNLKQNSITAIADVRSSPYSRLHPQFNREAIKKVLKKNDIAYVFLGDELGARSDLPACYVDGKVQFEILAKQPHFQEGLNRLLLGIDHHNISLMCAEKDPLNCHRTILVARQLHMREYSVLHILYDGTTETHKNLEHRMLKNLGMEEPDLFRSEDDVMKEAYVKWGNRIAYELPTKYNEMSEDL